MFARTLSYHANRFHDAQEMAWLAYKAGLDLVLPWGRRSGKSDLFAEILAEDVEDSGYPSLFVAKTQKQARAIIWPKINTRLRHEPGWRANEGRMEFVYKGGPLIRIRGADLRPDDLAGGAYRIIAADERALWAKPDIWERILAPMLGDYNGQSLHGSTKRGKNHFYRLHQAAIKDPGKYFVNEATIFDNPFISDAGRAKVLSEYAGGEKNPLYKQEILNQYVVFEGQVFALDFATFVRKRWDPADLDHSLHWRGMDHGFSPDPTAAVWIAYNRRKAKFQVYSDYKQHALLIAQHAEVIQAQERWPIIDSYSDIDPQVIAEYDDVGLALTPASKTDKQARLLRLVNALRTGKVEIAECCTPLLDEMASLTWEQVENENGEDHLVDAFDYGFNNISLPTPASEPEREDDFPDRRSLRTEEDDHAQDFGD